MLKHFLKITIAIISSVILFSILTKISPTFIMIFNVFNLMVLYFALEEGEVYGAVMGSAAGLIQESFSMGVFGIAGISKTILGFMVGYISRRINVVPLVRRTIFIFIMLLSELLLWILLYSSFISPRIYTAKGLLFLQPVGTTVLAFVVFPLFKKLIKSLPQR